MEAGEVVLLVSLIILAFSNYSVCYLSRMYIRSKPFGAQTNYDLMYCDILCLVTILILTLSFTIGSSLVFRYADGLQKLEFRCFHWFQKYICGFLKVFESIFVCTLLTDGLV